MKNKKNKMLSLKNILKTAVPIFGLSLFSANQIYSQSQKDSTENKKIYEDFKKFVKLRDNWHLTLRPKINGEPIQYYKNHFFDAMATSNQVSLYFDDGEKIIEVLDNNANGLNPKENDIYYEYQIDGKNIADLKELTDSNSIECSNQFLNMLKKIMRSEGFEGY